MIQPRIKEVNEESLFFEIFDSVTSGVYIGKAVKVSVCANDTDPWKPVEEGLDGQVMLIKMLKFSQVKFMLDSEETTHTLTSSPNLPNALMSTLVWIDTSRYSMEINWRSLFSE